MANWPNFLVIGTPKAGTTSLYHYLKQHPEVFMSPKKEPRYFSYVEGRKVFQGPGDQEVEKIVVKSQEAYLALFSGVKDEKGIGEASVDYLGSPVAPERIARQLPHVKLIAVLRNPVDRAYSNFLHVVRQGREPLLDFESACKEESKRIQAGWMYFWHYTETGFYYRQLKEYYKRFPSEQIKVVLYQEFERDNKKGIIVESSG